MAARGVTVAMVAALGLALGACGGDEAAGGEGASSGPISVQVFGGAEELALYRELVAAYRRETGREVRLIGIADRQEHLQKLATGFAGGAPPSAFLINYRNFASYASRGVLDPVGPRLAQDRELSREDFFPQPVEAFTYDGELACLPQNASSLVVYYNEALFEKARVAAPEDDWTYDEFRDRAERLTRDGVYGAGVEPGIVRLAAFVWAAGGEIVDDARNPTRFTLDTPEARKGLQNLLDLYGVRAVPLEKEVESKPLEDRFIDGELAMFLSSRREVPSFREIEGFEWDVAPFPRDARPATVLHSDAWCISEGASADGAWAFVRWASGPAGQRLLAEGGRIVPSLRSVAESEAFLSPSQPPRSAQVFIDNIQDMRRLPVSPRWPEIEDAVDEAIKRAFYDELTVDDALLLIREETNDLLRDGG